MAGTGPAGRIRGPQRRASSRGPDAIATGVTAFSGDGGDGIDGGTGGKGGYFQIGAYSFNDPAGATYTDNSMTAGDGGNGTGVGFTGGSGANLTQSAPGATANPGSPIQNQVITTADGADSP